MTTVYVMSTVPDGWEEYDREVAESRDEVWRLARSGTKWDSTAHSNGARVTLPGKEV